MGRVAKVLAVLMTIVLAGCEPLGMRDVIYRAPATTVVALKTVVEVIPSTAGLSSPQGLTFDASGTMYVTGTNTNTGSEGVFQVATDGSISDFSVGFSSPRHISYSNGYFYVIDGAGSLNKIFATDGTVAGSVAGLTNPWGVSVDSTGTNLYMSEPGENIVYGRTLANLSTIVAIGTTGIGGYADGSGHGTYNSNPLLSTISLVTSARGVTVDPSSTYVYIADTGDDAVRRVNLSTLLMDTIAGSPPPNVDGKNVDGSQGTSRLDGPTGVVADGSGNVYVADTNNNSVRMINSSLVTSTIAKGLTNPLDVAIGPDGNLYVADTGANRIVKVVLQ